MKILDLDFISEKNILFFEGRTRHPSLFGAILSILYLILVVFITITFSLDLILKRHPVIFYYKKITPDIGKYYVNDTFFYHYLELTDNSSKGLFFPNSFVVIGTYSNIDDIFHIDLSKTDHWIYEQCTIDDEKYNAILGDTEFIQSYCLHKFFNAKEGKAHKKNNSGFVMPTIYHGGESRKEANSGYGIYVMRCFNISYRDNHCEMEEEIIKKEKEIILVKLGLIDNDFDLYEYKDIEISYFLDIKNHLQEKSLVNNNLNFNPVKIITDDGILLQKSKVQETYNLDFNEKIAYNRNKDDRIISAWNFLIQNRIDVYYRSYPKILQVLANVGGLSRTIFYIASFINYLPNKYIVYLNIHKTEEIIKKTKLDILNRDKGYLVKHQFSNLKNSMMLNNSLTELIRLNNRRKKDESHHIVVKKLDFSKILNNNNCKFVKKNSLSFFHFIQYFLISKNEQGNTFREMYSLWKRIISEEEILKNHQNMIYLNTFIKEKFELNIKSNTTLTKP